MEDSRAIIGALIIIGLIIGANFLMYATVRGATRSNKKSFLETLRKSLAQPTQKQDDPMDELRRRIRRLEQGKKDYPGDSE
jgi:hypothetical protein